MLNEMVSIDTMSIRQVPRMSTTHVRDFANKITVTEDEGLREVDRLRAGC
jgi:hypothetical protein